MSQETQLAISSGVVVATQSGYRCVVCDKVVTDLEPHLRGKDHYNNLAWEAVKNPAPNSYFLNALPQAVREAKQRNELGQGEKRFFVYKCLVCPNNPVNGIRPLETHLQGRDHENAKRTMPLSSMSPNTRPSVAPALQVLPPQQTFRQQDPQPYRLPQPQYPSVDSLHPTSPPPMTQQQPPQVQYSPSPQPPASGGLAGAAGLDPELQRALEQGVVERGEGQAFRCRICNTNLTGVVPCLQHLRSDKHKKKVTPQTQGQHPAHDSQPYSQPLAQGPTYHPPPQPQTQRQQPTHDSQPYSQPLGQGPTYHPSPQPQTQGQQPTHDSQPYSQPLGQGSAYHPPPQPQLPPAQTQYPPDILRQNTLLPTVGNPLASPLPSGGLGGASGLAPELQRALEQGVVERSDHQAFRCRVCDKNVTGAAPCLEHLRSDKHKKKEQTQTQQPIPGFGQMTLGGDERSVTIFDSLPRGTGRSLDQPDAPWVFPWPLTTTPVYFQPSDTVYRSLSLPRGLVIIFNYCFPGHREHERRGAQRDSSNLDALFKRMGYQVYLYENLTKSQTKLRLDETQNNQWLEIYDSLIMFILSHGKDDQVFYTASCRDEDCMRLDAVRYKFTDTECPALKGKPKLFFVNFCRSSQQTAYDGMSDQRSEPSDMMTLYSCINSFRSPRDPETGTYFVQAWCEVLAQHAYAEDVLTLHNRVCQLLRARQGATPEQQAYYFIKKFYFNPVHTQQ